MWDVSTLYGGYIVIITSTVAAVVTITILVCTYRRHKQLQVQQIRNKELTSSKTSKKKTSSPSNRRKNSRNEREEGDNNQRSPQLGGRRDSGSANNHGRKKKRKRSKAGVEKLQDPEGEDENEENDLDTMLADVDFIRGDRRESKTTTDTIQQVMRVESVHMNTESVNEVAEMKVENGDPLHKLNFSESGTHFVNSDTSDTMILDKESSLDSKNLGKGNSLKPPKSSLGESDKKILDNSEVQIKTESDVFQKSVSSTTYSAPKAVENSKEILRNGHDVEIDVRQVSQPTKTDPKVVSQKGAKKKGKKAPQNAIDRFKAKESAKSSSSELSDAEPVPREGRRGSNNNNSKKSENFVTSFSVQKTKEIPLADSDTVISHEDSKAVEMCIKIPNQKQRESKSKKKNRKDSVEALKDVSNSKTSSSELSETEVATKHSAVTDGDVMRQDNDVPTVNAVKSQLSFTNGHDVDKVERFSSDEGRVIVPKSPRKGEQKARPDKNFGQDTKDVFIPASAPVSVAHLDVSTNVPDGFTEKGSWAEPNKKSKQPPLEQDSIRPQLESKDPSQEEPNANGELSEKVPELELFPSAARIDYRGIMDTSSDASASDTAMNKKNHDKKSKRQRNKKTGRRVDKEPEQTTKGRTIAVEAPQDLVSPSHRAGETLSDVSAPGFVTPQTASFCEKDSESRRIPPMSEKLGFKDDGSRTKNTAAKKAGSTSNSENESGSDTAKLPERRKSVTFSETIAEVIEVPSTSESMPDSSSLEPDKPRLWKPENLIAEYPGKTENNDDVKQQTNEAEVTVTDAFVVEQSAEASKPVSPIPQVPTTTETPYVDHEERKDESNPEVKRKVSPEDMPIMFNWGGSGRILTPKSQPAKTEKPRGKKKRKGSKTEQPETSAPADVKPNQKESSGDSRLPENSSRSSNTESPSGEANSPKRDETLGVLALEKDGVPEDQKTGEGVHRKNVKKFSFDWADDEDIEVSPNVDASGASESDSTGYHPTWTDEDEWKRGAPQQDMRTHNLSTQSWPKPETVPTADRESNKSQVVPAQSKKNRRNDRKKPGKEQLPDRPKEASIQPTEPTDKINPSESVDEREKSAEPVSSSGKLRNLLGKKPKDRGNKQKKSEPNYEKSETQKPSSGSSFDNREEEIKSSNPPVESPSQEVTQLQEAKSETERPKEASVVSPEVATEDSEIKFPDEATVTVPSSTSDRAKNDDHRTPTVEESVRESFPVDPKSSGNTDTAPKTKSITFNVDEPKSSAANPLAQKREETDQHSLQSDEPASKTKMLKNLFGKKDKKRKGKDNKKYRPDSISSADLSHDEEPTPKKSTEIQGPVNTSEASRAQTPAQEPDVTESVPKGSAPASNCAELPGKEQHLPPDDLDASGVSGQADNLQPQDQGYDTVPGKTELICTIPQLNSSPKVDELSTENFIATSIQKEQMPVAEIMPVGSMPESIGAIASSPEGTAAKHVTIGEDVNRETKSSTPTAVERTQEVERTPEEEPMPKNALQEPEQKPLSKTKKLKKLFGGKKDKKRKGNKLDTEVSRLRTESTSSMVSTSSAESHDDEPVTKIKGPDSGRLVQAPFIPHDQTVPDMRENAAKEARTVSTPKFGEERPDTAAEVPTIAKQTAVTFAQPKPMTALVTEATPQAGPQTEPVTGKPEPVVVELDVDVGSPVNDTKSEIMAPEAKLSDTSVAESCSKVEEQDMESPFHIQNVSASVNAKSAEVENPTEIRTSIERDVTVPEETGTVGLSSECIMAEPVLKKVPNQEAIQVDSQMSKVEELPAEITSGLSTSSDRTDTMTDSPSDTNELGFVDEPRESVSANDVPAKTNNEDEQQTKAPPVEQSEKNLAVEAEKPVDAPTDVKIQQEVVAILPKVNVDVQPAPSEPKISPPSVESKPVSKTKKLKNLFGKKKNKGDKLDLEKPRTASTSSADNRSEDEPLKITRSINMEETPLTQEATLASTEKAGENPPSSATSTPMSTLERPTDKQQLQPGAGHNLSSDVPSSSSSLDSRKEQPQPMTKTKKLKNLFSKKHRNDKGLFGRDRTWSTSSAESSASENVSRNPAVSKSFPVEEATVPEEAVAEHSYPVEPTVEVLPTVDDEASTPSTESVRAPEVSTHVPADDVTVPAAEKTQVPEQALVLKVAKTERSVEEPVHSEIVPVAEDVQTAPVKTVTYDGPSSDGQAETIRPALEQVPAVGVTATALDDEKHKVIQSQNPPSDYLDLAEFVTKPHPTSPKEPVENISKEVKDPFKYNSLPLPEIPKDPETTPKTKKKNKLKGLFGKKKDKDTPQKGPKEEVMSEPAQPKRPTLVETLILPKPKDVQEDYESANDTKSAEPGTGAVEEHVHLPESAYKGTETVQTDESDKPVVSVAEVTDNRDIEPCLTEEEAAEKPEADVAKNISDSVDQFAEEAVESHSANQPVRGLSKEPELKETEPIFQPEEMRAVENREIEQNQNEESPLQNPAEQLLEVSKNVAVTHQQPQKDVDEVRETLKPVPVKLETEEPSYRFSLDDKAEDNKTKSLPLPKRETDESLTPKTKKHRLSGLFGKKKGKPEKESKSRPTIVQSLILPENKKVSETETGVQKSQVPSQSDDDQAIIPVFKTDEECFPERKPEPIEETQSDSAKIQVTPASEVLSSQSFEPCAPDETELMEKSTVDMATPKLRDMDEQIIEQPEDFPLSEGKPVASVNEEEIARRPISVANQELEEPSYQMSLDGGAESDSKTKSLPLPTRDSNKTLTPKTKKKNRLSDLFGKKKDKAETESKSRPTIVQSLILPEKNTVLETEVEEPQPDIPIQADDEHTLLPTPHAVECFPDMKPVQIEAVHADDGNITVPADEVTTNQMFEPCLPREEETKMPIVTDVKTPNPSDLAEELPEQPDDVQLVNEQPDGELTTIVEKPKPLPTEKLEPEKPAYQLMQDDIAEDIKTRSLPMPKRESEEAVTPKTKKKKMLSGFLGKKKQRELPKISNQLILPQSAAVQEEPVPTPMVAAFVEAPPSEKVVTPMIEEDEQMLAPVPGAADVPAEPKRLLDIASEPLSEEDERQPTSDTEVRSKVPDEVAPESPLYNEQPNNVKAKPEVPLQIAAVKLEPERETHQPSHDDVAEDLKTRSLPLPKRESGESVTPKNKKKSMLKGLFGKKKTKEVPQISQQLILPQTAYVEEEPMPEPKVATLVEASGARNLDSEQFTPMTESGHNMQERANVMKIVPVPEESPKPKTLLTMLEETNETSAHNDQPISSQSEDTLPVQETENRSMVNDSGAEVIANVERESTRQSRVQLPVVEVEQEIREEMPETPELIQDTVLTVDVVPQISITRTGDQAPEAREPQSKVAGFLNRKNKPGGDDRMPDGVPILDSTDQTVMQIIQIEEDEAEETLPSVKTREEMPESTEAAMPLALEGEIDDGRQTTSAVSAQDNDEALVDSQAPALMITVPVAVIREPAESTIVHEQIPKAPTAVQPPSPVPVVTISPPPLFFSEDEVKRKKPSSWFEFDEFDDDILIPVERSPKGVEEDPGMASVSLVAEVPTTEPETPEISGQGTAEEIPRPPSQYKNDAEASTIVTVVPPPLIFTESNVQPKKEKTKRKGFFGKKKKGDKDSAPATPETPRQALEPSPQPTRVEKSGSLKGSLRNLFGKKKKRPSLTELIVATETKTDTEAQQDAPSSESSFDPSSTSSGRGSLSFSGRTPKTSTSHDDQIERDVLMASESRVPEIQIDSLDQKKMDEDLEKVVQELVQETLNAVTAELEEIHGSRPISQTSEDSFDVSDDAATHDSQPSELPNDSDYFGEYDEATPIAMSPEPGFIIDDAFADLSTGEISSIDIRKPSITSAEDIKVRNSALMPTGEEDGMDMDDSASLDTAEEERATPVPEDFVPVIHLDTTFSDADDEVPRTNAVTDESDVLDSSFDPVTSSGHSGSERSDNEAAKPQRKKSFRMRNPFKKTEKKDKSPQEKHKSNVSVDTIVEKKPSRLKSLFSKKNVDEPKTDSGTNTLESTKSKTKSNTLDSNASNKSDKKRSKLSFLRRRKDSKEETKPRVPVPESETDDELFKPKQEVAEQVTEAETKPEEHTFALALPTRTPDLTTYETSDDQYESDASVMKAGFLSEHDHSGISTGTLSNISQKTLCMNFKHINTLRANYMRLYWEIKFSENLACMAVNSGTSWSYYAVVRDVGWPMKFKVGRCTYVKVVITSRDKTKCRQMGEIMRRVIVRKKTPQCRARAKHLWRHLARQMDTRNIGVLVFTTDDANRWGLSLPTTGQYAYTHWDNFLYFAWLA